MSDLGARLEQLGLSQYLPAFLAEGFDTWETALDITESDLNSLNVKLGHRRKLQRAIAETRGQLAHRPLQIPVDKVAPVEGNYRSDDSAPESRSNWKPPGALATGSTATSTKRKYRRHPKPDEHAPERPPSAYVIFSNQVRETLKGQDLSFTEIAKVVGERWQVLPANAREACERQANAAKEKYYAELSEYKKTTAYESYQKYLEEFKTKHALPAKGAEKRSKLDTETSHSTRSSSNDHAERPVSRRVSIAQSDTYAMSQHGNESSPPTGSARLHSGPSYPVKPSSPVNHSRSGFNSPRNSDPYSPLSASPRSATLHKESSGDYQPSALGREAMGHPDPNLPFTSSTYGHTYSASSTTGPLSYGSQYKVAPVSLPSRHPLREPTQLPPLSHEETTLSSDSGSRSNPPLVGGPLLPIPDATKMMRILPQPVPSLSAAPSPLDRPLPPISAPPRHPDYRTSSSLAALLRAGELARVADIEATEKEGSP